MGYIADKNLQPVRIETDPQGASPLHYDPTDIPAVPKWRKSQEGRGTVWSNSPVSRPRRCIILENIALEDTVRAKTHATIDDLYKVEGKAELVNGEIVCMSPTGGRPSRTSGDIYTSLRVYERRVGGGYAFPNNAAFAVQLPHRESFSPDASWYVGSAPDMRFLQGAPVFAVEVRSEYDYGRAAERAMREKRADYFACGTQVVWDVDLQSEDIIKCYKASDPENSIIFKRGDVADAEPAVPGWRMAVDELFG